MEYMFDIIPFIIVSIVLLISLYGKEKKVKENKEIYGKLEDYKNLYLEEEENHRFYKSRCHELEHETNRRREVIPKKEEV